MASRRQGAGAARKPPHPGAYWLWGVHPLRAALANPNRRLHRVLVTAQARPRLPELARRFPGAVEAPRRAVAAALPAGAAHQGCAALAAPLDPPRADAVLETAGDSPVVVLDRVSDPRNVGAVLRSAAAFGAAAVIVARRGAPPESGVLAKAAAGALDIVPLLRAGNLARALRRLADAGWWLVALDDAAAVALDPARLPRRCAFVLGAEGAGLRRLTREACDECVALPLPGAIGSLNVSNACAVALYAATRAGSGAPA